MNWTSEPTNQYEAPFLAVSHRSCTQPQEPNGHHHFAASPRLRFCLGVLCIPGTASSATGLSESGSSSPELPPNQSSRGTAKARDLKQWELPCLRPQPAAAHAGNIREFYH